MYPSFYGELHKFPHVNEVLIVQSTHKYTMELIHNYLMYNKTIKLFPPHPAMEIIYSTNNPPWEIDVNPGIRLLRDVLIE
jgi:hypothetical protein